MKYKSLLLLFTISLWLMGCKKQTPDTVLPKVTDVQVETAANSAIFQWTVDYPGKVISVIEISENRDMTNSKCYGQEKETDNKTFTVTVEDLKVATRYYYRFLVWNQYHVDNKYEMAVRDFSTTAKVITHEVENVTRFSATFNAEIVAEGYETVTECGFCWGTKHNPTMNNSHKSCNNVEMDYSMDVDGLQAETTYYLRAYVINEGGIAYADEVSFRTADLPEGAIKGVFSVSETGKVWFSKGNLQYRASANKWQFASKQYSYIGDDNANISENYDGWIDLFGWGTSGYNHGAVCYQPWSVSRENSDYLAYGLFSGNLYDGNGQADWGYNPISNGGNMENRWRTLSGTEWEYLLNNRSTLHDYRFAKAKVNGTNGLILFPDDWNNTDLDLVNINSHVIEFKDNLVSSLVWNDVFESNGAVFLPNAGDRGGNNAYTSGYTGYYWTSSNYDDEHANYVYIGGNTVVVGNTAKYWGKSVRLVMQVE